MPLDYRYEAVDAAGRRLNGTLTADSEKDARRKLFEQGLVVSKLQGEAKAKTSWDWRRLFNKPLSTMELILFTQQFRTLYMAGISLPEALRILHDQAENKQFKWVVGDMQRRVLEGESLDEGAVSICGVDQKSMDEAANMVKIIATDFEAGQIFTGKVVSIKEFGAFVEFAPGKEGMVHISKICKERINRVEDVLTLGDKVKVICLGKDKMGRISFSMKDVPEEA